MSKKTGKLTKPQRALLKALAGHPRFWSTKPMGAAGARRTAASLANKGLIQWVSRGDTLDGCTVEVGGWVVTTAGRAALAGLVRHVPEVPGAEEREQSTPLAGYSDSLSHPPSPQQPGLPRLERPSPDFEGVVAALEKFTGELQSEIEWISELHRRDMTGQARADQATLSALKAKAQGLSTSARCAAEMLGFGFNERKD